ncbi:MAG: RHS repeat-associated core domain-containing protein [Chloroflexaceae bacterium]|nr:RHS repeat-associated core domain-containing protein [Chloroflexaceae bacterium]
MIVAQDQTIDGYDPTRLWYHHDGLGSVVALTNDAGELVTAYEYDEYGMLLAGNTALNSYTYTGQPYDRTTGLYHFYARSYDPVNGVWLQQDPYRGTHGDPISQMRYMYVGGNPVNHWDVMGYFFGDLVNAGTSFVSDAANSATDFVSDVAETTTKFVSDVAETTTEFVSDVADATQDFVEEAATMVVNGATHAYNTVTEFANNAAKTIEQLYDKIVNDPCFMKMGLDTLQLGLDVAGLIPVVGEFADGANGLIHLARGELR